jgi:20S proteasome alpha/beta subunit
MEQLLNDFKQPSVLNLQGRDFNEALTSSSNGYGYVQNSNNKEHRRQWSPYEVNGGTIAAIAVEDKIIMGADSR